jgi:hypothetical protein
VKKSAPYWFRGDNLFLCHLVKIIARSIDFEPNTTEILMIHNCH